jgi:carbonic anhydrase
VISQHLLGTEEVIVIEHTGCGMLTFEDEPVRLSIAETTGVDVDLPLQSFPDLEANLKAQIRRIRAHPWVKPVPVSGLVYEVETGRLRPVAA